MKTKNMKRNEIIKWIESLACSQGFYCRLLQAINDMPNNEKNALFEHLESQSFAGPVDFIMYIENI